MTDQDHIDRINALTRNARNTWFALLGVLVFVGITLMGVAHIDFYGVNRATKLPLVDVEVPTRNFFAASPILVVAIYGYFHLYLIRLSDALGSAPARLDGKRLGDAVMPWLVIDAALQLRKRIRNDNCTAPRPLETGAAYISWALVMLFGPGISFMLWLQSMPARAFGITASAGLCFGLSIIVLISSLKMMYDKMRNTPLRMALPFWQYTLFGLISFLATALVLWTSYARTSGDINQLASLNLNSESLVEKPEGWLPYEVAQKDFKAIWCQREVIEDCSKLSPKQRKSFDREWKIRRDSILTDLVGPNLQKDPNFRKANLGFAFMSGRRHRHARMEKANFREATLEGAVLKDALLNGANLYRAHLERTNLSRAQMNGVNLRGAFMEGAILQKAQLVGADLLGARMKDANLKKANMLGVRLAKARMDGANLNYSALIGYPKNPIKFLKTNLSGSKNQGGAIRFADLRTAVYNGKTNFRNVFLDASVLLPEGFSNQMGGLCQGANQVLDDNEFYGQWRGWVESNSGPKAQPWTGAKSVAPPGWEGVTPIPPPPGCHWKTGPMPSPN